MLDFKQLMQSMTNRLIFITIVSYFVIEALFAGALTGLELYHWRTPNFRPWQLLSYLFLHGDFRHLGFNMLTLWFFGRTLERVWGGTRFLLFYLACGIGAAIISQLVDQFIFSKLFYGATIGASGAVYAILVAFALLFPNFKIFLLFIPFPVAAKYFVLVLLLIDLSAGITGFAIFGDNIAHFVHLGGALMGLLLVTFWLKKQ